MRIGLVIYGNLEILTGGYLYDKMLVNFLKMKNVDVEIFSLKGRNYFAHCTDNFSSLEKTILNAHLDILLQDELNHPSLFWMNKRLAKNIPVISIVHQILSVQPRNRSLNCCYKVIERAYFQSLTGCIFNSTFTKTTAIKKLCYDKPSIVVYPGKDRLDNKMKRETIQKRRLGKKPLALLFLGNITKNKRILETLQQLLILPRELWLLYIVGSGQFEPDYFTTIKNWVRQNNISNNVIFCGPLNGSKLESTISKCHIMLLPFTMEGFGMAYIEGMGFGLPAFGSTQGAAGEIITHGFNGYLIGPKAPEKLAAILKELYYDRQKLTRLSLNSLQTYNKFPSWETSMENIYQYLCSIYQQNRKNLSKPNL